MSEPTEAQLEQMHATAKKHGFEMVPLNNEKTLDFRSSNKSGPADWETLKAFCKEHGYALGQPYEAAEEQASI